MLLRQALSTPRRSSAACDVHNRQTYGMPMVVALGLALGLLVGVIILGVFFFQLRDQFDSLDIRHMEQLKDH